MIANSNTQFIPILTDDQDEINLIGEQLVPGANEMPKPRFELSQSWKKLINRVECYLIFSNPELVSGGAA